MLTRVVAAGWRAEPLGEEAGAALSIGEPQPGGGQWLLLALRAADLAADAGQRAAALVAGAAEVGGRRPVEPKVQGQPDSPAAEPRAVGSRAVEPRPVESDAVEPCSVEPRPIESHAVEQPSLKPLHVHSHYALPRVWQPSTGGQPATLALPAPGAWRVDALLPAAGRTAAPELLCRLLLAELLDGLAAAHRRGWWHGLLTPGSLWLAGAPPERLIADCPRDPRVVIVGCGVLAMLSSRPRAAAVASAPRRWVAPELRSGAEPGPAADVWAAAAVVRALLPTADGAELRSLLDAMQAARPESRPSAAAAAAGARELALAGFAAWQREAPPPPRLVPSPAPLLPAPGSRPRFTPPLASDGSRPVAAREARTSARWTLQPPSARPGLGLLPPMPFVQRPLAAGPAAGLWLSMAPTAMAGILSVLLAMALLFAAQ